MKSGTLKAEHRMLEIEGSPLKVGNKRLDIKQRTIKVEGGH